MPTSWHYKSLGQEFGPITFRDLTRMVREGELSAEDLVRPEYDAHWQRADEVPGLLHMAHVTPNEPEPAAEEWDDLKLVSEADVEELLPSDEQPAWMKRILARLWSGETVSESEKERVVGFLRSGGIDAGPANESDDEFPEAKTAGGEIIAGDLAAQSSLGVGGGFYGETQPKSAVGALLAEMDEAHEAEVAAAEAKRRGWRFSLKDVASDGWLWTQVLRVGAAMLCANLAFFWLEHWTATEALRFPGLLEKSGMRMIPMIGSCSPTEYWLFIVDLTLVAAGLGYTTVKWVQRHLD